MGLTASCQSDDESAVCCKVHIYKEYSSVCPLVGIGTLPTPLSPVSVPLTLETKGGGGDAHLPAGKGLGESHIRRLEKKLSTLPTLLVQSVAKELGK
jgi:hypothetical protein